MSMINTSGVIWLKNADESIPSYIEDFFDKNPLVSEFVEHVDHQIVDALIFKFQSNFPNEHGTYLSVLMQDKKDPEEKKRFVNIRDSKHTPFDDLGPLGGYSRRRLEVTCPIGTFLYKSKRLGPLRRISNIPKKLILDHKCEHTLLPHKIKNTIPPLDELVEGKFQVHVKESVDEIRNYLGRDLNSYLFEIKDELGIRKLSY